MRILVTGPREWPDEALLPVAIAFAEVVGDLPRSQVTVIHGAARGFDFVCDQIAWWNGWAREPYPVSKKDWYPDGVYDPQAAHKRNQVMVDTGADWCIAGIMPCPKPDCWLTPKIGPHNTHGTADCMRRATRAGIPIREVRLE